MKAHIIFVMLVSYPFLIEAQPLFQISEMQYVGGYRLSAAMFGNSELSYSQGPIAYNPENHSLFIVGHAHHQSIAEFPIPIPSHTTNMAEMQIVTQPIQVFSEVLSRSTSQNPQMIDRIGGMYYLPDPVSPKLLVNAFNYYDAAGTVTHTSLAINDANNLANSSVSGYFSMDGAAHAAGWISEVPASLQSSLGGDLIAGNSSGIPIISRTSVGPSAFVLNATDFINAPNNQINATPVLDFSLSFPLHEDLSNDSLSNDIWTHLTQTIYGFIVPGTNTYFTIGSSGGHRSGVCYKCVPLGLTEACGGYCSNDASDYDYYYWLWDLEDLMLVKNGQLLSHEVRPYDYGVLDLPLSNSQKKIGGATFDKATGKLYLSIQQLDNLQGIYSNPPVILVYQMGGSIPTSDVELNTESITLFPNPNAGYFKITGLLSHYMIQILDVNGQVFQTINEPSNELNIDLNELPSGMYFIRISNTVNSEIMMQKILKY
ncbi:MAG: T9SS type A sorting domain-containing protein [Saprospiraceae bacterium]